jgi:Zn-dependent peptidase ImmA (M78 family)
MVKWFKDRTGRFAERPHYEPAELDTECERLVSSFLKAHTGKVEYPITTDDLTVLIEQHVKYLDVYADLSPDGSDVEGVTRFAVREKPVIEISQTLSTASNRSNRYRTTLAHELGHAKFHDHVFQMKFTSGNLFAVKEDNRIVCKRDGMIDAPQNDWMEWQAGYASGAYLMPKSVVTQIVRGTAPSDAPLPPWPADGELARALVRKVMARFEVSEEAARIRLIKLGHVTAAPRVPTLFG